VCDTVRGGNHLENNLRPTRTRYIVVAFMILLAMVTYLDRASIGAMAPSIAAEFSLDDKQMSWVFASFILAYAIFEIPTARYADRHGARGTLTRIVSWWSIFTFATAGAFNYSSLLVTRFVFGMGEAGAWPCVARVFSRWIPLRERATITGIFFAGAYASAAATNLLVAVMLPYITWRTILMIFGSLGFVWIIAFRRWFRDDPTESPGTNAAERDLILRERAPAAPHLAGWAFWKRLFNRNVLLLCVAYMPNCATFYFCITWLTTYLEKQYGFAKTELGLLASLPLALCILTQFFGGYCCDRLVAHFGLKIGRRTPGVVGYALAAVFVVAASLQSSGIAAAVLFAIAAGTCMITTATSWSTCVDIGREHSATVGATMNTSGQLGAILSQPIIGYSVAYFGNFNVTLLWLGGLLLTGAICWLAIDPTKPVFEA
jgi:MFS transporter, ACS family, glucarate transporter